jgi:hypothetical protein
VALELKDRVGDTSATTGTGTLTLAGVAPAGLRTFSAAGHTTGATIRYLIASSDFAQWETGEGVWTSSGNTLTRVTVYASTSAGALVNFSAGTKNVTAVLVAQTAAIITHTLDKIRVYNATGGATTSGAFAKIPFDTVEFDTGSMWDATNLRIKPTKAGYYHVDISARTNTVGSNTAGIRVSGGTTYAVGAGVGNSSSLNFGGSILVYCNGTTDYIEGMGFTSAVLTWTSTIGLQHMSAYGPL